tara:strand:+ start:1287 stop:1559 length:273 start_codon:yes stop_codon:yes gene_type:complete
MVGKTYMPFEKKPYRKIGDIYIPRPPTGATHIYFKCDSGGKATVAIKDVDTLCGVSGLINFLKLDNKNKVVKKFEKQYNWNGEEVEGLNI